MGRSHARPTRGVGSDCRVPAELPRPERRRRCRAVTPESTRLGEHAHTGSRPPGLDQDARLALVAAAGDDENHDAGCRRAPGRAADGAGAVDLDRPERIRRQQQTGQHPDAGSAPPGPSGAPSRRTAAARPPPQPAAHPISLSFLFGLLPSDLLRLPHAAGGVSHPGGVLLLLSSVAMGVLAVASFALFRRLRRLEAQPP